MLNTDSLLTLPWDIQVALVSGYASYMIAYVGIRDHHKAPDIAFKSLAFGLIASAILLSIPPQVGWFRFGLALIAPICAAVLWRKFGIDIFRRVFQWTDVSWADDTPSAWMSIGANNSKYYVSQIAVLLDDGTWLNCATASTFSSSPFGPCVLGSNGDVALYVTEEIASDGSRETSQTVQDSNYGDRITYVPASRIRRISLRHLPKALSTRDRGEAAGVQTAEAAAEPLV